MFGFSKKKEDRVLSFVVAQQAPFTLVQCAAEALPGITLTRDVAIRLAMTLRNLGCVRIARRSDERWREALHVPPHLLSAIEQEPRQAPEKDMNFTTSPPARYLRSLPKWDGKPRLATWLGTYLGADNTPRTRNIGQWFYIGLVARALNPGCWFPFCLVLVAEQGAGKSSALSIIAGDTYRHLDFDPSNRDALAALRNPWILEIDEMRSITRMERARQKSFLTRQSDTFRPIFERREITVDRQGVFAGTTCDDIPFFLSYLYWPVICTRIDLDALEADRDQLFSEAVALYTSEPGILSRLRDAYTVATLDSNDSACSGAASFPNWRHAISQHGSSISATNSAAETEAGSLWYAESQRSIQAESSDEARSFENRSSSSESIFPPSL